MCPGTFDPVTPGHLDIIERARHIFARITVLVAVNGDKQPATTQSERVIRLRRELPADWDNLSVTAWAGLTVEFCRRHGLADEAELAECGDAVVEADLLDDEAVLDLQDGSAGEPHHLASVSR